MTILVTGSNGQLGSELRELSVHYPKHQFIFLDRESFSLEKEMSEEVFKKLKPGVFINCAAYTAVDKAEEERELAMQVNGIAPGKIAALCKKYGVKMIHISTDYVFNGNAGLPFKEDDPTDPQNHYGFTKMEGERNVLKENEESIIIRTSWVYSSYGKNFVKTMLRLFSEKKSINVVSDQVGSPTYAADLAEALMQIIESGKWEAGIYHYSNEGVTSWYEFAEEIKQLSGASCTVHPIPTTAYPTPAKRPAFSVMDLGKIKLVYNIHPKNWKSSLRKCLGKLTN